MINMFVRYAHLLSSRIHGNTGQGGDWGSSIVRYMALNHAKAVQAIHINMFLALPPDSNKSPEKHRRYVSNDFSEQEIKNLERTKWFATFEARILFFESKLT